MIIYLDSIFIQFFELQKIYSWSIRKMEKRWEIFVLWFMSWPVGVARDFPVLLVSTLRGSGVSPVSHSLANQQEGYFGQHCLPLILLPLSDN